MKKGFKNTLIGVIAAGLLVSVSQPAFASGNDVYLMYSLKNKKDYSDVKSKLPKSIKSRSYKVDLLAIADYSGKQKAVTKAESAKVVILFGATSQKLLKGSKFKRPLIIVNTSRKGAKSDEYSIFVVMPTGKIRGRQIKDIVSLDVRSLEGQYTVRGSEVTKTTIALIQKILK